MCRLVVPVPPAPVRSQFINDTCSTIFFLLKVGYNFRQIIDIDAHTRTRHTSQIG